MADENQRFFREGPTLSTSSQHTPGGEQRVKYNILACQCRVLHTRQHKFGVQSEDESGQPIEITLPTVSFPEASGHLSVPAGTIQQALFTSIVASWDKSCAISSLDIEEPPKQLMCNPGTCPAWKGPRTLPSARSLSRYLYLYPDAELQKSYIVLLTTSEPVP